MNTQNQTATANTGEVSTEVQDPNTVTLDTPIKRGNQVIEKVAVRKPSAGELRGTSLSALVNFNVDALQAVLPRVTSPTLTEADIAKMDPADLMQLGGVFVAFLWPKGTKESMGFPTA